MMNKKTFITLYYLDYYMYSPLNGVTISKYLHGLFCATPNGQPTVSTGRKADEY
jgi:hypothetical protein